MARLFYRVTLTDAADEEHRRLSPVPRQRIKAALRKLAYTENDLDIGSLENAPGMWRVRVNRLRIVFERYETERVIPVTRVRPRETAYDGIERPPRSRQ